MAFAELVKAVPLTEWPNRIHDLRVELARFPNKTAVAKDLLSRLIRSYENGRKHSALCLFVAGLLCGEKDWFERIRRSGLLRASRRLRAPVVRYIVSGLLRRQSELALAARRLLYLQSILHLLDLETQVQGTESDVRRRFRSSNFAGLRNCLAITDFWFLARDAGVAPHEDDPIADSAEELADGYSALHEILAHFSDMPFSQGRPQHDGDSEARQLEELFLAKSIRAVRESEILVEHYGYRCYVDSGGFVVEPTDQRLDQSIQLGYELYHQDKRHRAAELRQSVVMSMRKLEEYWNQSEHIGTSELVSEPYARLVFDIPDDERFWTFFRDAPWFSEELANLQAISNDLGVSVETILGHVLVGGVTFKDLFGFQRFINVLRTMVNRELRRRIELDRPLVMNSLVLVFGKSTLLRILGMILLPEKVSKILDFLTWHPNCDRAFDLLYQPVLASFSEYFLPLNVIGNTNLVRNSLQLQRARLPRPDVDPIEAALGSELLTAGMSVFRSIAYAFRGVEGDIDLLAIDGNKVFIFECKNSLHPCSAFELRASFDLIRDAEEQLEKVSALFTIPDFIDYLSVKLNYSLALDSQCVYSIVTGNHMFVGWNAGIFPVRGLKALLRFISDGNVIVAERKIALRPPGRISTQDLILYLTSDGIYEHLFESMEPIERDFEIGERRVSLRTFKLNWLSFATRLGLDEAGTAAWLEKNERLQNGRES